LFGQEVIGTFQRVVAPANIKLTDNNRRTQTFPIVNFVREDFEYIKQLLKTDWEREVFPSTGSEPLTGEQQAKGYRTWTDRKGVPFNGKYVRSTSKEVVLESAGGELTFPYPGFSEEDRTWISEEQKRRSEEASRAAAARQQQSAASQSNGNRFGSSRPGYPGSRIGYPGSRIGYPGSRSGLPSSRPGYPGSRIGYPGSRSGLPSSRLGSSYGSSSGLPTYSFKCDTCGRTWTDIVHFSQCTNCADTYHFKCHSCGHSWTKKNTMFDNCPSCSGKLPNNAAPLFPGIAPHSSGGSRAYFAGRVFGALMGLAVVAVVVVMLMRR
jgi:predicted nucleic acid-binding Zn ribbon protein